MQISYLGQFVDHTLKSSLLFSSLSSICLWFATTTMDPSMTAFGAVQLTITSIKMFQQITSIYGGVNTSTYQPPKMILSELRILTSLLQEIQDTASSSTTEPSQTVSIAMQISAERFQELLQCLTDMGLDPATGQILPGKRRTMQRMVHIIHLAGNNERLQDVTRRFKSALTLLRDIVMDLRTHDLITQQQEFFLYEFHCIRAFMTKATTTLPAGIVDGLPAPAPALAPTASDALLGTNSQAQLRFSPGASTLISVIFSATVSSEEKPFFFPGRAKFDTACPDCLISSTIIERYKLEDRLDENEVARTYIGLGNVQVISTHQLHLNWSANNEAISRQNIFYVVADSPFDFILGENFMSANSPLIPAFPVCMLNGRTSAEKKEEAARKLEDDRKAEELIEERERKSEESRKRKELDTEKQRGKRVAGSTSGDASTSAKRQHFVPRNLHTPPQSPTPQNVPRNQPLKIASEQALVSPPPDKTTPAPKADTVKPGLEPLASPSAATTPPPQSSMIQSASEAAPQKRIHEDLNSAKVDPAMPPVQSAFAPSSTATRPAYIVNGGASTVIRKPKVGGSGYEFDPTEASIADETPLGVHPGVAAAVNATDGLPDVQNGSSNSKAKSNSKQKADRENAVIGGKKTRWWKRNKKAKVTG
ncbi:hypothetical protein VTL71DRAFT_2076 [Oculimacula yallundae]|uniref:Uncharacterized protein n=1 Tax=Oculimacula yallundae TaxID=86028 RepID=A0ABR4C7W2_9HELO